MVVLRNGECLKRELNSLIILLANQNRIEVLCSSFAVKSGI